MTDEERSALDRETLEANRRMVDLGRRWHVVIGVQPNGDWLVQLLDKAGSVARYYVGPDLNRAIGAAWSGAPSGRVD